MERSPASTANARVHARAQWTHVQPRDVVKGRLLHAGAAEDLPLNCLDELDVDVAHRLRNVLLAAEPRQDAAAGLEHAGRRVAASRRREARRIGGSRLGATSGTATGSGSSTASTTTTRTTPCWWRWAVFV